MALFKKEYWCQYKFFQLWAYNSISCTQHASNMPKISCITHVLLLPTVWDVFHFVIAARHFLVQVLGCVQLAAVIHSQLTHSCNTQLITS